MYLKPLTTIHVPKQPQSPPSLTSSYFSFQQPPTQPKYSPTIISHECQSQSQSKQLQNQKQKLATQLQNKIHFLQQIQEILQKNIQQIISCQEIGQVIRDIGRLYTEIVHDCKKIKMYHQTIQQKQQSIVEIQDSIQVQKIKINKFKNNLAVHLRQIGSVNILLGYGQKHNIRNIVQQYIHQFIDKLSYSIQQCFHNHNPSNSYTNQSIKKCLKQCPYSQLIIFVHQYKNQCIERKIKQLWQNAQKQIHKEISQFTRLYSQDINMNVNVQKMDKVNRIKKQIMDIKIDLEICKSQNRQRYEQIGLLENYMDKQQWQNAQYFVQCVLTTLQHQIKQIQSSFCNKKQYNHNNYYNNQPQFTTNTKISNLSRAFLQYMDQINKQYIKQNKTANNSYKFLYQASFKLIGNALIIHIENIYKRNYLFQAVTQLQDRIKCIQMEIRNKNKNGVEVVDSMHRVLGSNVQMIQGNHGQYNMNKSARDMSSRQQQNITVKKMLNIDCMQFRVKKTMHISNSVGIVPMKMLNSGCNSRISSSNTSRSVSRLSIKSDRKRLSIITQQQCNQRILQFYKKKLILRKQNPHFHQQIQIKRIKQIKILNNKQINIYFKKGYMNLQFLGMLTPHTINNKNNKYTYDKINYKNYVKLWVKCFKAVYYDIIDGIQFRDEVSQNQAQSNLLQKQQQQQQQILQQNTNRYINKQNIQQNLIKNMQKQIKNIQKQRQKIKSTHKYKHKQNISQIYELNAKLRSIIKQN